MILQEAERLTFAGLLNRAAQGKCGGEEAEQAGTENYNRGKHEVNYNTNHNHTVIATTVARLFSSLAQLLYDNPDHHPITRIDRKQRRQIDEKKLEQGMNLK